VTLKLTVRRSRPSVPYGANLLVTRTPGQENTAVTTLMPIEDWSRASAQSRLMYDEETAAHIVSAVGSIACEMGADGLVGCAN